MRRISIFGATGSIGQNTIDLIADGDGFAVEVLTGGRNVALLAAQARRAGLVRKRLSPDRKNRATLFARRLRGTNKEPKLPR